MTLKSRFLTRTSLLRSGHIYSTTHWMSSARYVTGTWNSSSSFSSWSCNSWFPISVSQLLSTHLRGLIHRFFSLTLIPSRGKCLANTHSFSRHSSRSITFRSELSNPSWVSKVSPLCSVWTDISCSACSTLSLESLY